MDQHLAITWARATVPTQRGVDLPWFAGNDKPPAALMSSWYQSGVIEIGGAAKPLSSVVGLEVLSNSFPVIALGRQAWCLKWRFAKCIT